MMRPLVLLGLGLAITAGDAYLIARWGTRGSWYHAGELIQMVSWLLTGYLATRVRPASPIGRLMLGCGLVLAGDSAAGLGLPPVHPAVTVIAASSALVFGLQLPVGAHVLLAFPTGRIGDRAARVFLGVLYPLSVAAGTLLAAAQHTALPVPDARTMWRVITAMSLGALLIGGPVLARRIVRAGRRERRVLVAPGIAVAVMLLTFAVWQLTFAMHLAGLPFPVLPIVELMQIASVSGVPLAFLIGLFRQRWDEAAVAHLVRDLAGTPPAGLPAALARTLGDPLTQLGLAGPDGFQDVDGQPFIVPDGSGNRRATFVGTPPQAVIVHDASLCEEPTLLRAVAEATRFVLENDDLQIRLREQVAAAREIRTRLVQAGDSARRRLERDLHDGAQQQMLAVGLTVQLLRRRLDGADLPTIALLEQTEEGLRTALAEMRRLARGIHPAVLTTHGLAAALGQLARQCPVPVALRLPEALPRPSATVEATAYFIASEALANVVRHAGAATVAITVVVAGGRLRLTVTDDGRGGARPGGGLTGLTDRVAATGGVLRLDSPPGGGTTLEAELPCG